MKFKLTLIFVSLFSVLSFAQRSDAFITTNPNQLAPKTFESFKDRLYYGGGIGLGFGRYTYVSLQPMIGVRLTEKFSLGGGVTYNYYSINDGVQRYETSIYGGNAFARYLILENLFAQVGWDRLNVPNYYSINMNSRAWVDNILVGGGYRQKFADNASFVIMGFYNINQTPLSPYQNPILQMGFNLGF